MKVFVVNAGSSTLKYQVIDMASIQYSIIQILETNSTEGP